MSDVDALLQTLERVSREGRKLPLSTAGILSHWVSAERQAWNSLALLSLIDPEIWLRDQALLKSEVLRELRRRATQERAA